VQGSVLEEERKAAAALPQSSRLPPPPPAAADPSRPNPLLSMPTAELRALTAQLEGDIEQTMQHHKQDMVRRLGLVAVCGSNGFHTEPRDSPK